MPSTARQELARECGRRSTGENALDNLPVSGRVHHLSGASTVALPTPGRVNHASGEEANMAQRDRRLRRCGDLAGIVDLELHLLVYEAKRAAFESTGDGFDAAHTQLADYGERLGHLAAAKARTMFGTPAVGRFVRFYVYDRRNQGWSDTLHA